ncbi:hypothetical protein ACOMHN_043556 [Nucella lapillus]
MQGVRMAIKWHDRFWPKFAAVKNTLDTAENVLSTDIADGVRVNLTAAVEDQLTDLKSKVDEAVQLADSLGYNKTDGTFYGLILYMKNPTDTVNVGGHYSGGVFTVPQDGLYKVLVRNLPAIVFFCRVYRNGNEILILLESSGFFDVRTRMRLIRLNKNDEIFFSGSTPSYFLVMRLRLQTLVQDSLD